MARSADKVPAAVQMHPEMVAANLLRASLVVAAYEFLRHSIVDGLCSFFAEELGPDGAWVESDRYRQAVLSAGLGRMKGSLRWLSEEGVLDESDLQAAADLRLERNRVSHQLASILVGDDPEVDLSVIEIGARLVQKIGRFWSAWAIACDETFDHQAVDVDAVEPGLSLLFEQIKLAVKVADRLGISAFEDVG